MIEHLDQTALWTAVDGVLDDLVERRLDHPGRLGALRDHRVHLLVARRARERGRAVPAPLHHAQRVAAVVARSAPRVLARARSACDGPLMLMKGAEVAAHYPDPLARPYVDVDLLAPDAVAVQRALLASGFRRVTAEQTVASHHHLAPLHYPGLPVRVEVHGRPNWVPGLRAPAVSELFDAARPSRLGVPGILAPAPEHHAVMLAVHAWSDRPLGRLGRLIDVEAVALAADAAVVESVAREWGCARVWRATRRAGQSVLLRRRPALSLRLWARHVPEVRDRTVLDAHLETWLAPAWAFPSHQALGRSAMAMVRDVSPHPGESWARQAARVRRAVGNAGRHEREYLEDLR